MNNKRFFLLEPNLKKSYGHVIEFPFTLQSYLQKQGYEAYVICNKNIDKSLLSTMNNTYPLISQGTFEDLENKGAIFAKDLESMDKQFSFKKRDVVINLTSYTNQIFGVGICVDKHSSNQTPAFGLWFHQTYQPTDSFSETQSDEFQKKTSDQFVNAFMQIQNHKNINIYTTSSIKLRETFQTFTQKPIYTLPLPYSKPKANKKIKNVKKITFGFLGDGRYEKGLPIILEYLHKFADSNSYIIEDIYPRGYSEKELSRLKFLETEIKSSQPNVVFITDPLTNSEYKNTLKNIDVFLMPYHPDSYDKRVSGIFIEAARLGIPVISTSNTWMAEQVNKYKNGVLFDYFSGANGLNSVLKAFVVNQDKFSDNAKKLSQRYNKIHTPDNFIKTLLETIN